MKRAAPIFRYLSLLLAVQFVAVLMTLWAHLGAAMGLDPASVQLADAYAPGIALFLVSWYAARGRDWSEGLWVALGTVGLWVLVFWFLTTRFLPEFWHDGIPTPSHLIWWLFALAVGLAGGYMGFRWPSRSALSVVGALLLCWLWARQGYWGWSELSRESLNGNSPSERIMVGPRAGVISPLDVELDGTTGLVVSFDLGSIDFALADADWTDSHPLDNRNATWLGTPQDQIWQNLEAQYGEQLACLVNGGFFGASMPYIAQHEAPMLSGGTPYYLTSTLSEDWPNQCVTLAWKRRDGALHPFIVRAKSALQLKRFDGALGGVRVLIENGKKAILKPGMGGTTLKCSRTSVAWNDTTFAILSVRDPDGEASSLRQNRREKNGERGVQVGGWDVAQVQRYWKEQGFPNAVLFDGGESGQVSLSTGFGVRSMQSSYHFTRTLGFLDDRPLRAVLPMWPPTMANGGVLNWFAVVAAN